MTLAALFAINQKDSGKGPGRGCALLLAIVGFGIVLLWWLSR
jgi:uncharacterized protein HemX